MKTNLRLALVFSAAALVAAAPVFIPDARAQRQSLADRVAALEQQAAGNPVSVDLLNQVTQMRSEIQALRAQNEELAHQLEQLKQSGKSQYLDIDSRLTRLEGGAPAAPSNAAPAEPVPTAATPAAGTGTSEPEPEPVVYGDAGTLALGADERSAYDAAFDVLKSGRYAESAQQFQAFLDAYPNGTYTPNALYWLGESYYVTQNYELALQQFQDLLRRYPTHDKAPGALLKVGLAQYGMKDMDAAEATLTEVTSRYPGTDAARTADDRLRAIQFARLR
jgi:tol-pal system protein YbgF